MFRADRTIARALLAALLLCAAPSRQAMAQAGEVEAYLEEHGLEQLLALHLEERLERAAPDERPSLAVRLAELYARLLETTDDVSLRVDLESRSRQLLEMVPAENADELRLALLRGSYSAAERIAENHRLRLSDEEAIARAQATLAEIIPQFQALRGALKERLDVAERRRTRSRGAETARLTEEVDAISRLHSRALFLFAWAQYYHAWLAGSVDQARQAEALFSEILDPDIRRLTVDEVSRDLLSNEPFARAVLGMALSKSLTSGADTALRWMDLLAEEDAFEPLRTQAPAWRMTVMLEHDDFRAARNLLESAAGEGDAPLAWLRLAAVHALEAAAAQNEAADLARFAIAQLAARGELQQVLDLATRYGVEWMGQRGFAPLYVQGVQIYQQAREQHGGQEPTPDSDLQALYLSAAEKLEAAVAEPDAAQFATAAAGARALVGWCRYFSGRFIDARAAFEKAADDLTGDEAVEALWMAIVSLDRVVTDRSDERVREELNGLIRTFLERHPSSEYAPRLVLRQAEQGAAKPSLELVEGLLNVPPNSHAYPSARRRAADMLYQMFRDAAGDRRMDLGERYLNIALPLWQGTSGDELAADETARETFIIRARRILEVALSPDINRRTAAEQTLARLTELELAGTIDLSGAGDELAYRHFQVASMKGDVAAAEEAADRMWERADDSPWTTAAVRSMFKEAVDDWRAGDPDDPARLERVIHHGGRVLQGLDDAGRTTDEPAILSAFATVAEATMRLWRISGEEAQGRRALFLYDRLLEHHPSNVEFLRAVGILAAEFGDRADAVAAWRKLVAGSDAGSEIWLEAKYHLISLLAEDDPLHAREVMDQHKAIYPDYGPAPWNEKFRELDESIPAAAGDASDGDGVERAA